MEFRSNLISYETVLIKNKSVDLQRDIISTLNPAVFMSCLDFAFPIPAKTSVHSKILLEKFRSFTTDPRVEVRNQVMPVAKCSARSSNKKISIKNFIILSDDHLIKNVHITVHPL